MRVLVVGGGGREHAIVWRLRRDRSVREVVCAPGNPGIAALARCVDATAGDVPRLVEIGRREAVDLVVVGPEAPLCAGLADALRAEHLPVFGPSAAAARLEGSKSFAKELLRRHGVPTADFAVFDDEAAAQAYVAASSGRVVVKADGLASGKGVVICGGREEAARAVHEMLGERRFGAASSRVVIEERLFGREASVMALVRGEQVVALPPAEDHKAAYDGDRGPMTGGMGAVSPTPAIDGALLERALREVLQPVARACVVEGHPYMGVLYAGLMIGADGVPHVLEINCRLGDPEAETILPRLDGPLSEILLAVAAGQGAIGPISVSPHAATCVVMASAGYPGEPRKGDRIDGLDAASAVDGAVVFHAGTRRAPDGSIVSAGGRVLAVTATGKSFAESRARAYQAVDLVHFDGTWHRKDIGARPR